MASSFYYFLFSVLSYQNKNQEALDILNKIKKDFQGFPIEDEALFKAAQNLISLKKFNEAITLFKDLIALDPEGILNDNAYYQMAELYNSELNLPDKAKEYYQKIIFEYPSSIYLVDARKKFRQLRGDEVN